MIFKNTDLPYVKEIIPDVYNDDRGYFMESYNKNEFNKLFGHVQFVQDNESMSKCFTIRGLHYQLPPFEQQKLVRVVKGKILDVAVDIDKNSPNFGKYTSVVLTSDMKNQLWIPKGHAHGFVSLEEDTLVVYKTDQPYSKKHERGIIWNDDTINIDWNIDLDKAIISEKDKNLPTLL